MASPDKKRKRSSWETAWAKIRFAEPLGLLESYEYHNGKPDRIPRSVVSEISVAEALELNDSAHQSRYEWRIADFPRLDKKLSEVIEETGEEQTITDWESEIREAVFDNYTWLRRNYVPDAGVQWLPHNYYFGNYMMSHVIPRTPDLKANLTGWQREELTTFGFDIARIYFRM